MNRFAKLWMKARAAERRREYKVAQAHYLAAQPLAITGFAQGHLADALARCRAGLLRPKWHPVY